MEGRSRKYTNEAAVAKIVKEAGYEPYEQKLLGITAMTGLLGKSKFEELPDNLVVKPQEKPTFAPMNDKRPVMNTAAEDFEILLFGYSVDGGAVEVIDIANGEQIPQEILDALTDESIIKWAFNANFERVCLSRYLLGRGMRLDPFRDNYPLSMECAGFLSPRNQKD